MKGFTKFAGGFTGIHSAPGAASYEILLVGAGGAGGGDVGGGGAGGQVVSGTATFGTGSITITVGAGGASAGGTKYGLKGNDTSVSGPITLTSANTSVGGSGGQGRSGGGAYAGGTGFNGGGGSYDFSTSTAYSGGFAGGTTVGPGTSSCGCGGGGGSGGAAPAGTGSVGGAGGAGVASLLSGSSVKYGGGGGGSQYTGGSGGAGTDGGGNGNGNPGGAGVANRGGGGGGGQSAASGAGGAGGSGVVILSCPTSLPNPVYTSGATLTTVGSKKIYTWNTSGTLVFTTISSPSVYSGLVGWYDMSAVTSTQWTDKSGLGNHATISGATATTIAAGNGATLITNCLYGSSTSHTVLWPAAVLPSTYTLFHVTRYTGGSNARIYQGYSNNWLSGHWGGLSGQYYHSGWITNSSTNYYGNNWFITTDQNSLGRTNGITRGTGGGGSSDRLCINTGVNGGEASTWQTVECIVYNRTLTSAEYTDVELYLAAKYGITLNT